MFHTLLTRARQTRASHSAAAIRLVLGLLFLSTGVMKFVVPELRSAFSGQLAAANIPFHALNMWLVPAAEIVVSALFSLGLLARLASLASVGMMIVATYVHLVVHDPTLFPLQPEAPIVPILTIFGCLYVTWRGSGSWSLDLRDTAATAVRREAAHIA